ENGVHPKLLWKVLAFLYPQKKCVNPFKSDRCFPGCRYGCNFEDLRQADKVSKNLYRLLRRNTDADASVGHCSSHCVKCDYGNIVGSGDQAWDDTVFDDDDDEAFSTVDVLLDLIRNMVPKNLVLSSFKHYKTQKVLVNIESDNNNSTSDTEETQVRLVGKYIDGLNTLEVIGMSFIFGLALRNMGETGKLLMDIISAVNEATKEVVKMIIGYTDIVPTRRPFNT
ncbi:excitatory amino acid transporter-like, partial [Haplochromis burtoni]|uniref:excitatory amino acid transporter-like n=1 Tax=Haplochromis burtoni TaxID=8153 RepID=UPI001C2D7E55